MMKQPKNLNSFSLLPFSKLVVLFFACLMVGYFLISCSTNKQAVENKPIEVPPSPTQSPLVEINPNLDFSKFNHSNPEHDRLPCLLCHKREDNSAVLKLPGHLPCSGCHTQQFADNKNTICTICHTNPESGEMKSFPTLKSFAAVFDHGKHLRETNCATCHKPLKNGVAMSILSRNNSHATCFQCHEPEKKIGDKDIGNCSTCHPKGNPPAPVTTTAKAYSTPFSHAEHNMACSSCHTLKASRKRGDSFTEPVAAMHFPPKNAQSCGSCHDNKRAFGGTDFADCKRCHTGNNFKF